MSIKHNYEIEILELLGVYNGAVPIPAIAFTFLISVRAIRKVVPADALIFDFATNYFDSMGYSIDYLERCLCKCRQELTNLSCISEGVEDWELYQALKVADTECAELLVLLSS